jgi:hypothetical protein
VIWNTVGSAESFKRTGDKTEQDAEEEGNLIFILEMSCLF